MKKKRYPAAAIGLSGMAIFALFMLALAQPAPLRALQTIVFDTYQQIKPRIYEPESPVRIVAIDDSSLQSQGQWPWPRATLARLVSEIAKDKPAVIVLDLLLSEPARHEPDGDARLAAALLGTPNVLGQVLMSGAGQPAIKAGFSEAGDDPRAFLPDFRGAIPPLPDLQAAMQGVGALNFLPERDFIVRKVPLVLRVGQTLVPSLAAEGLRIALGADSYGLRASNAGGHSAFGAESGVNAVRIADLVARTEADGTLRVHFSGHRPQRSLSAESVLKGDVVAGSFGGKIVLIGATASALADLRATPLDPAVPGVEIHAEAIEHLLSGNGLSRPDYAPGLEAVLVILTGGLGLVLGLALTPLLAGIFGAILATLVPLGSWLAFQHGESLLDPIPVTLAFVITSGLAAFFRWRVADLERMATRHAFSRYVSPVIVERLVEDPSRLSLGGETRIISVLFADLHDFTRISEPLAAEDVIGLLNRVHEPLTEIVLASGGTIDKFLGDGLMAFWNAPVDQPDHAARAVRAALAMIEAVKALSTPETKLEIGIGIATGKASVGNVGATRRFDYSAVGDIVNVAARIEKLTRDYHQPILIDEETAQTCGVPNERVDEVILRGRSLPSPIHAPILALARP